MLFAQNNPNLENVQPRSSLHGLQNKHQQRKTHPCLPEKVLATQTLHLLPLEIELFLKSLPFDAKQSRIDTVYLLPSRSTPIRHGSLLTFF